MGRVFCGQSGYHGCSMSDNAVMAYSMGEKPKSKWSKATMLEAIEDYGKLLDRIDEKLPTIRKMTKTELFAKFFEWKSWHHTGKYANETDFYGLDEDTLREFVDGEE